MAPADEQPTAAPSETPARRRVVFPWVWIAVVIGARVAFQFADVTADFKNLATLGAELLILFGLSGWYLVRGRMSLPARFAVAALPFMALLLFTTLFEIRFDGAGGFRGIHRRGAAKADQLLGAVETATPEEGLTDWGPGEYDYPRFLGTGAWAESVGPAIATDWDKNPPTELWRRDVGAGWSAFAVYGPYAVTQEQRGEDELVVCYRIADGEPVWSHADPIRFDPQDFAGNMGRQGPRATPTIVGDRVYTQGATGMVNCLDARTGKPVWAVQMTEKYDSTVPVWGKSGSPLFVPAGESIDRALVIINVGAPVGSTEEGGYDASLVALDAETGDEVWSGGWRQTSYASPMLLELDGQAAILQTCDDTLEIRRAADGVLLGEHPWFGRSADRPSCSQPIALGGDRVLLTKGYGHGASLVRVEREGEAWTLASQWTPAIRPVLQTKYSNAVVRDGHAYALNGEMLQCVEIESGKIAWRKRRRPKFGFGQVLLVGDHVLVQCEDSGEAVLVEASPEKYRETAAFQVLTEGETCWNNPVVAGDILLVRNAIEARAYRLPLADAEADAEEGDSEDEAAPEA